MEGLKPYEVFIKYIDRSSFFSVLALAAAYILSDVVGVLRIETLAVG